VKFLSGTTPTKPVGVVTAPDSPGSETDTLHGSGLVEVTSNATPFRVPQSRDTASESPEPSKLTPVSSSPLPLSW
jgi:hypothetical protein